MQRTEPSPWVDPHLAGTEQHFSDLPHTLNPKARGLMAYASRALQHKQDVNIARSEFDTQRSKLLRDEMANDARKWASMIKDTHEREDNEIKRPGRRMRSPQYWNKLRQMLRIGSNNGSEQRIQNKR